MADTTVSEDDIADVSLINTPIDPPSDDAGKPGEPADEGKDNAADPKDAPAADDKAKPDANGNEAKGTEAKEPPASDKPAEDPKTAEGEDKPADESQQPTDEQRREEQQRLARQEYQQRQRARQEAAQQIDKFYGPKTEEQLVEDGLDPADAKVEALRQEMAFNNQRTQIAELNSALRVEAVNAQNDFGVFNPKSQDYDEDFTKLVDSQYQTAARVQVDEHGIITNADVPLYDFYKQMADIYSRGTSKGAQQGQAEMRDMLARTENPGGSSSAAGNSGNSLDELEERLGDVVIT